MDEQGGEAIIKKTQEEGMSRRNPVFFITAILALLGQGLNYLDVHSDSGKTRPSTRGSKRHERFRPDIPDGKWVMKHHRSRR